MALPKKSKRKSKPPSKLKEYVQDETAMIQKGPRRSRRSPKITEKLKHYMDEQAGVFEEGEKANMTNRSPLTLSSRNHKLLGSKYKEPKVVLKALPSSAVLRGALRRNQGDRREVRVTLRRLGNSAITKTTASRTVASKLHKQVRGHKVSTAASSDSAQSSPTNRSPKTPKTPTRNTSAKSTQSKTGKHKRGWSEEDDDSEPQAAKLRRGDRKTSSRKPEPEDDDEESQDSHLDPLVMQRMIAFGSKLEEVMASNLKETNRLTRVKRQTQSLNERVSRSLHHIEEGDIQGILLCLEESEKKWKNHRDMMMEAYRASHKNQIVLYSQMLSVLQSVTYGF